MCVFVVSFDSSTVPGVLLKTLTDLMTGENLHMYMNILLFDLVDMTFDFDKTLRDADQASKARDKKVSILQEGTSPRPCRPPKGEQKEVMILRNSLVLIFSSQCS